MRPPTGTVPAACWSPAWAPSGRSAAQALEADENVEVIVGLDTTEPTVELERTEYVRADANY